MPIQNSGYKLNIYWSFFTLILLFTSCKPVSETSRQKIDFNFDWKFILADVAGAEKPEFQDQDWKTLRLPHDWSIEQSYTTENTACSTGFLPTGIGWYRKSFSLPKEDQGKTIWIEFDGVTNNSEVFLNGESLGKRPSGFSSFSYELSDKLKFGDEKNILAVRVDHHNYADSRWYTGSGINRNVRLIVTSPIHIPIWGNQILTPEVSAEKAKIRIETKIDNRLNEQGMIGLEINLLDPTGVFVKTMSQELELNADLKVVSEIELDQPQLWDLSSPNIYTAQIRLIKDGKCIDETETPFGIRSAVFDANHGFLLNGKSVKIKGVNMHDDCGLVGTAASKDVWRYRIEKLQSIGCNAIRMSHNAHSPDLMDLCDEMGMLVMDEAFDEWMIPKGKSKVFLGDNAAPKEFSQAYPEVFNEWSERDLKDLVRRDFNHPSVIMWSIGNEIEWTFPHYTKTYDAVNGKQEYNSYIPEYDSLTIRTALNKLVPVDSLTITAERLAKWVKEVDRSRPVTTGSVHPSVALASGYGQAVDVLGFNYRAVEYDKAHQHYPNLKILGSENWGSWSEWKNVKDRDFVAGMFAWTGFAYLGEAGPWPRKGLEISFFDFAGFKTPRGHFFECLWKDTPKVYMVTTPASESEYSFDPKNGWQFTQRNYAIPSMKWLRRWEWDTVYEKWNYKPNESIIVQAYSNCEEAELFLNGESLGRKALADFDDHIMKWLTDYQEGDLEIVGYNKGQEADRYKLKSQKPLDSILIHSNRKSLTANKYDVVIVDLSLLDKSGTLLTDQDQKVSFEYEGEATILGVDNGWEMNVQDHKSNEIVTHNGRALIVFQAKDKTSKLKIIARSGELKSNELTIDIN